MASLAGRRLRLGIGRPGGTVPVPPAPAPQPTLLVTESGDALVTEDNHSIATEAA